MFSKIMNIKREMMFRVLNLLRFFFLNVARNPRSPAVKGINEIRKIIFMSMQLDDICHMKPK